MPLSRSMALEFCEYGYAPFALDGVGVHDPVFDRLVFAEGVALPEHRVDERRLAVVDVGYYCYIS